MARLLLYVDDEPGRTEEYRTALEEVGFRVVFESRVSTALAWLQSHAHELACAVLDVMLPPENVYDLNLTGGGLTTGLYLYKDIRRLCGGKVLIYFLTNNFDNSVPATVSSDPNAEVVLKSDLLFDEFAELVAARLGTTVRSGA